MVVKIREGKDFDTVNLGKVCAKGDFLRRRHFVNRLSMSLRNLKFSSLTDNFDN